MGLFENLMDTVKQQIGGDEQEQNTASQLMGAIQGQGGLSSLIGSLSEGGLAGKVSSWVGTGTNQEVSGGEIKDAMDDNLLGSIAEKLGVDKDQASGLVASVLPKLIDQLTPGGKVETGDD